MMLDEIMQMKHNEWDKVDRVKNANLQNMVSCVGTHQMNTMAQQKYRGHHPGQCVAIRTAN